MFSLLRNGLTKLFQGMSQKSFLDVSDAEKACSQMRSLLSDADVHLSVIDHLLNQVREKASLAIQLCTLTPSHLMEVVHDEISLLLGKDEKTVSEYHAEDSSERSFFSPVEDQTCVWLLCGLPGQGKTTQVVKIALFLKKQDADLSIGLVCADFNRPMAGEQLRIFSESLELPIFLIEPSEDRFFFLRRVLKETRLRGIQLLLVDTAGCLDTDQAAMDDLVQVCSLLNPKKIFFVVHGGKGQSVLESGFRFHKKVGLAGLIVTMLDGEVKGGCVLSMVHRIGIPIVFEGLGEHMEDLRPFNPLSMADRILGLGDSFNLKKKLEGSFSENHLDDLKTKACGEGITFQDYLDQVRSLRKCGPLSILLSMVPGFSGFRFEESDFIRSEAIICSMTAKERQCLVPFSEKSLQRIALGSGFSVEEVMRLIQNFETFRSTVRQMGSSFDLNKLKKMMGGLKWH